MDEMDAVQRAGPASERMRVRRGAPRARYERDEVLQILDAGLIEHVGVTTPDGPLVLPPVASADYTGDLEPPASISALAGRSPDDRAPSAGG